MANHSIATITSLVSTTHSNSEIKVTRIKDIDAATKQETDNAVKDAQQVRKATAKQMTISREAFDKVVSELKAYVQNAQRNLDFQVDDKTGRVVVKVIDAKDHSVIRQIPSEEMLELAHRIQDYMDRKQMDMKGMLLEIKA
jgi:flagellar protein FlaG